ARACGRARCGPARRDRTAAACRAESRTRRPCRAARQPRRRTTPDWPKPSLRLPSLRSFDERGCLKRALLDHEAREVQLGDRLVARVLEHDLVRVGEHLATQLFLALERREVLDVVLRKQEQKLVADGRRMRL